LQGSFLRQRVARKFIGQRVAGKYFARNFFGLRYFFGLRFARKYLVGEYFAGQVFWGVGAVGTEQAEEHPAAMRGEKFLRVADC
jgi:hypothetical protein